jgi:uncharacterized lipoprotein
MTRQQTKVLVLATVALIATCSLGNGQDKPKLGFKDTPMLLGGKSRR